LIRVLSLACFSAEPQADKDLCTRLHSQMEELEKYRISASKLNVEIETLRDKITALEVQNQQLKRQGSRCHDCNGLSPTRENHSMQTERECCLWDWRDVTGLAAVCR